MQRVHRAHATIVIPLGCSSSRCISIYDFVDAHSCAGIFKQAVDEQYCSFKKGEGLQDISPESLCQFCNQLTNAVGPKSPATPPLF